MSRAGGWFATAGAVLLLSAAAAAAGLSEQPLRESPRDEPVATGTGRVLIERPQVRVPENLDSELPGWLPMLGVAAAVVAVVVVFVLVARRLGRRVGHRKLRRLEQTGPRPVTVADEELLAVVDAGLADLSDTDSDPRRAVIACWLRLEEAAAVAGTPRHDSDTATDLVVRLLRSHQVSESVLAGLAEVYLLARFTTHTVDARMRDLARTALHRLRSELAAAAQPEPTRVGVD